MRTPKDLADDALTSDVEHARRATALRRLAASIRAQASSVLGLSDKERKTLTDAFGLLERMAEVRSNDRSPEALVAEAWTRFERTKAATQAKHRVLIEALGA